MEYRIYDSDELAHHGIKGMRWGIRRFQNKDGSLTPAGEKRRAKLEAKIEKLGGKKTGDKSDDGENKSGSSGQSTKKKSISEMSDNELASAINRARMEDAYRQLRPEPVAPEKHPMMKKMLNEVVAPAAVNAGKQFLQNAISKAGENLLKGKADPNSIDALKKTAERLELQNRINKLKKNEADEPDWGNLLKKQQYERNKKKYEDEDATAEQDKKDREAAAKKAKEDQEAAAKKDRAAESRANRNDALNNFVSRAKEDASSRRETKWESSAKKVREEFSFDSDDDSSKKVYEGTVEGFGTSSRTRSNGKKWTENSTVIDADFWEVVDSNSTNSGRSYVNNFLALPMPGLPEGRGRG